MGKLERLIKKYMQMTKDGYETVFITTVIMDLNNLTPIRKGRVS